MPESKVDLGCGPVQPQPSAMPPWARTVRLGRTHRWWGWFPVPIGRCG